MSKIDDFLRLIGLGGLVGSGNATMKDGSSAVNNQNRPVPQPTTFLIKNAEDQYLYDMRKKYPDSKLSDDEYRRLYKLGTSQQTKKEVKGMSVEDAVQNKQVPPAPTPTLAPEYDEFEQMALPILNQYGIPPAVGFGMYQAEGGKIGNNNPYNLGAFDSNPNNAYDYKTPNEGVEAYAKLIAEDSRYAEAYGLRSDPVKMMQKIKDAGYAGDPKTWKQRSIDQARRAGKKGAGEIYDAYDQFVKDTSQWRRYSE